MTTEMSGENWFDAPNKLYRLDPIYVQELPNMTPQLQTSFDNLLNPSGESLLAFINSLYDLTPADIGRLRALRHDMAARNILGQHPYSDEQKPGWLIVLVRHDDLAGQIPGLERADVDGIPLDIVIEHPDSDVSSTYEDVLRRKDLLLLELAEAHAKEMAGSPESANSQSYHGAFTEAQETLCALRKAADAVYMPAGYY